MRPRPQLSPRGAAKGPLGWLHLTLTRKARAATITTPYGEVIMVELKDGGRGSVRIKAPDHFEIHRGQGPSTGAALPGALGPCDRSVLDHEFGDCQPDPDSEPPPSGPGSRTLGEAIRGVVDASRARRALAEPPGGAARLGGRVDSVA